MNHLDAFLLLASRARGEPAPAVDVSADVLRRIRAMGPRRDVELPLLVFSGVSLLAATIVVAVAVSLWAPLADPLAGLFRPCFVVMQ